MIRLTAVAIVFVGLLTASDASYGQLSSRPTQTWTLSERHAWDPENVLPPGDAVKEYVLQAPAPERAPPERLPYFVRHLNSDNSSIAADALDEASLVDVKHFRMLPASEVEPLKTYIINPDVDEFRLNLDRLVAGYLLAAGDDGLDVMDESFLKNKERGFNEVYAAMTALRFVWSSDHSRIEKERLRASMRLLIDRPEIADLVITELALWKDWSVQDRVVALYGKGEFDRSSVKRAILRYLLTSDRDVPDKASDDDFDRITRTRKHLEALKERDPETYQQASRFFPLSDPRPREPKQGRDDARGDFAPVASGLSGLRIYTSAIHTITFSRDGETLLSGSGDGTLGWWGRWIGCVDRTGEESTRCLVFLDRCASLTGWRLQRAGGINSSNGGNTTPGTKSLFWITIQTTCMPWRTTSRGRGCFPPGMIGALSVPTLLSGRWCGGGICIRSRFPVWLSVRTAR